MRTLSRKVYVFPSEPSKLSLFGRVLVLMTCTAGLKPAMVTPPGIAAAVCPDSASALVELVLADLSRLAAAGW